MLLHRLDNGCRTRALADHAFDALFQHRRSIRIHAAGCRWACRTDRVTRLCRRRSKVVDDLIVPVNRQRFSFCKGLGHRLMRRIARTDDRPRNQDTVTGLELARHFFCKRSRNTDTVRH